MRIQLKEWKTKKIDFSILEIKDREKNTFNLKSSQSYSENDNKEFSLIFEIDVSDKEFNLFIEVFFTFSIDENITEEFKISDFPRVNAPAIAFPYLRALISNITLQAGFKPVILPSINFVEVSKNKI